MKTKNDKYWEYMHKKWDKYSVKQSNYLNTINYYNNTEKKTCVLFDVVKEDRIYYTKNKN